MTETKHERYLRLKKEKQMKALKSANKNLQKTVAVVGATTVAGLVLSPKSHAYTVTSNQLQSPAQQFLNKIIPAAQQATEGKDVYTSVMIAQAALESAWGTSALSAEPNHNLFGVKGNYNGQSVNMYTLEDAGAQKYYGIYDNFRKYPSYKESMDDYVDKIINGIKGAPMFYSGAWKSRTNSYQDATRYLTGRYATDTAYYAKLNRIIEQYGLTKYDNGTATAIASGIEERTSSVGGQYTVQAGDTLYGISRKAGVSVDQLLSVNALSTSSVIYPGQTLSLGTLTQQTNSTVATTVSTQSVSSTAKATANGYYTVKAGDTLYGISRKFGMSLSQLISANGISTSSVIQPGQTLRVVGGESASTVVKTNTASIRTSGGNYIVQSGDTLYSIARRSGMNLNTLLSINGLSQSSVIFPGQSLTVGQSDGRTVSAGYTPSKTTATSTSTSGTYTVQAGDTLYSIARRSGVSLNTLLSINGLSQSSIIFPGQSLTVGQSDGRTVSAGYTPSKTTSTSGTYTVQAGDTLYSIARRSGVSLNTLLSINGLSQSSVIHPGQTLSVSGSASQATATQVSYQSAGSTSGNGTYTVKAGDTLYRIAYNHGISLTTLLSINGLSETSTIRPGQQLVVSGSVKATTSTTKATTVSYSTGASTHTVQAGDTLFRIAKNNGLTLSELRALNGLTSNTIRVGQVLKVSK
ncbi:LysM peptidoglycan-binding domain-containing protein [Streptococcus sp. 263_SSPC]|uniref:LysM peptidoglycan-binding domain-containing protein n=1 Tax=Streptococcus sp. 263_SSPC TaxID=1579343 RepID=UPI000A82046E|nr:LysM peptidoglycan-binding domain-containing protein [Streptococcus sp. 263_SSPC]